MTQPSAPPDNLPPEGRAALQAKLPTYLANHCTLFNSDNLIQMVFGAKHEGDDLPSFQCSVFLDHSTASSLIGVLTDFCKGKGQQKP
jgi:hypothetical protein